MCEQTEINYLDGDVVWVKLGACWWPGQVIGFQNLPDDIQDEFKKKPLLAAVKFFQEDTFEFVKNYQQIYKYNCTLKEDFIRKGLDKYRSKSKDGASYMDKFPRDVEMAEKLTGGDPEILTSEKFCPEEKPDISALFGEKKMPKKKRDRDESSRRSFSGEFPKKITHPRFLRESDHEIRIRHQPSSLPSTPNNSSASLQYPCHLCNFTSSRINVIICHIKSHRNGDSPMPRSKVKTYSTPSRISDSSTPKRKYVRKSKGTMHKSKNEGGSESAKRKHSKQVDKSAKKKKTDPELREKLLADWDDESDDGTNANVSQTLDTSSIIDSSVKFTTEPEKFDLSEEHEYKNEKDHDVLLKESERLLGETEKLTTLNLTDCGPTKGIRNSKNENASTLKLDQDSDSDRDEKVAASFKKKERQYLMHDKGKRKSESDGDAWKVNVQKDDKTASLSCFDFDEEDLPEPTIPPVRKIPRVFGEKNLSLKKEIIKEFEMSQALKNEQEKIEETEAKETRNATKTDASENDAICEETKKYTWKARTEQVDEASGGSDQPAFEDDKSVRKVEGREEEHRTKIDDEEKFEGNVCETEVEIVEIFEVEREEDDDEANDYQAVSFVKSSSENEKSRIVEETNEKEVPAGLLVENLIAGDKEATFKDGKIVSEAASKKCEETSLAGKSASPDKSILETEIETTLESADTAPMQSEPSDTEGTLTNLTSQSDETDKDNDAATIADDEKLNVASIETNDTPTSVKKRRGRPKKHTLRDKATFDLNSSGGDSTTEEPLKVRDKTNVKKSAREESVEAHEKSEQERKSSDSGVLLVHSGRRRKFNTRYTAFETYLHSDYRSSKQKSERARSESNDKPSRDSKGLKTVEVKEKRGRKSGSRYKRVIESPVRRTEEDEEEEEEEEQQEEEEEEKEDLKSAELRSKSPEYALEGAGTSMTADIKADTLGMIKASSEILKESDESKSSRESSGDALEVDSKTFGTRQVSTPPFSEITKSPLMSDDKSLTPTESNDIDTPVTPKRYVTPERAAEFREKRREIENELSRYVMVDDECISKEDEAERDSKIQEQIRNLFDEMEGRTPLEVPSKTCVEMLPPKKSQIKKYELSQMDFFESDPSAEKAVASPIVDEKIDNIEIEVTRVDPNEEMIDSFEEKTEEGKKEAIKLEESIFTKALESKVGSEQATEKIVIVREEMVEQAQMTIESEKLQKSFTEEVRQPQATAEPKVEEEYKILAEGDMEIESVPTELPKLASEQSPQKSPMQTRYKGKFTPETGSKQKKEKDVAAEEKPINTFQEAFVKTLQIDKRDKKVIIDDVEITVGRWKKTKKLTKKPTEDADNVNIVAVLPQLVAGSVDEEKVGENAATDEESNVIDERTVSAPGAVVIDQFHGVEVMIERKTEIESRPQDALFEESEQLATTPHTVAVVTSEAEREVQSSSFEDVAKSLSLDVQKFDDSSRMSMSTPSPNSDISVPVKKREKPRIIENVTLKEPMQILKTKLLEKFPAKGVKHKLDPEVTKKGDPKISDSPRAKVMKIESLSPNSKSPRQTAKNSSSHLSLTKKLQALKAEEAATAAAMETQNEKLISQTPETITTLPANEKFIQQSSQSLADMELDINSMPFVLSEDILTPESIEQMPVVISSIIPASSSITNTSLTLTPTSQVLAPAQAQFKGTSEGGIDATLGKKKTGTPTILKNKGKVKPTITSIKTLLPPLTGGVKGLKFQHTQVGKAPPLIAQKGTPGKYVLVQTSGNQQLRYSVQGKSGTTQKIAIPAGKSTGSAQIVQRGGKVVILTSAQSGQTKMLPLNISKPLSGKVQRIMTSKGQVLTPINSQSIIAPKGDVGTATTSKLTGQGQKMINAQGIITSKGMLTQIPGAITKSTILGSLPPGILTKGGIYTPISASSLSGKAIIGSKTLVTSKGTILSPMTTQNLSSKAILTPISQALSGKAILNAQSIVTSKSTVLTPITGQQVKAIAAKSPSKIGKIQYQTMQQKTQLPTVHKGQKQQQATTPPSQMRLGANLKSPGGPILFQSAGSGQKTLLHGKKMIKQTVVQHGLGLSALPSQSGSPQTVTSAISQTQPKGKAGHVSTAQKVIVPKSTGRQTKAQQKIVVQKMHEIGTSTQNVSPKSVASVSATNFPTKTGQQKHSHVGPTKTVTKGYVTAKGGQQSKNLLNVALNSIATTSVGTILSASLPLPPLEAIESKPKAEKLPMENVIPKMEPKVAPTNVERTPEEVIAAKPEEPKVTTQPQIMALPTESGDGTQTYVLVTIDEQGQIQPLDNNTLMSLEGTTQNPDGTRTLYIDPSSLGEAGTLDNIVLQFDNGCMPNLQTTVATETTSQAAGVSESYPTSEIVQTSNQDILAAALANTDFQQEIGLPENPAGCVMSTDLTQTSLINQTILQSTIIPPTEPISSPSVLETSLTLNQPIMTPLEVPSNLSIQSESTPTSVVPTIPTSLELPITITNPNISYISTSEAQIQIPGNSMPDIGEIMKSPAAEMPRADIPASTQYLVIPSLEENIAMESQGIQSGADTPMSTVTYSVSIPENMVPALDTAQAQTTPSMPIIDDTYTEDIQYSTPTLSAETTITSEQSSVDVPVSEMLVSKAPIISTENSVPRDTAVDSEVAVTSQQVPTHISQVTNASENATSLISDSHNGTDPSLNVYSVQNVPDTKQQLLLQRLSTAESKDVAIRDMPAVTQDVAIDDLSFPSEETKIEESNGKKITSSMPVIEDTCAVTSESNVEVQCTEHLAFQVTGSSQIQTSASQEAGPVVDGSNRPSVDTSSELSRSATDEQTATSNQEDSNVDRIQIGSAESAANEEKEHKDTDQAIDKDVYMTKEKPTLEVSQLVEPSSREEDNIQQAVGDNLETRFERAIAETSQETPSQSYEESDVSITSDSVEVPSQSVNKSENSREPSQSESYEPMETDENLVSGEPPSQSFNDSKQNEASQYYGSSTEANTNAPTQSFNEIMQSQDERTSVDDVGDDQSFPTQSYEVEKMENVSENMEVDAELSQEGNIPSQSNDIGTDAIGTSSVSMNNSGLNEDETASSSYVPETPENQERDQDQESAISTSSYEIPPCEELNIASSSVIPDTSVRSEHTSIHDNGVPEIPTSSYNLNPDSSSSTRIDSVPTSSYEDQVILEQNVSTSYEVPISMPGLEETSSQNFVTESSDRGNEPTSYYAHHQEVTASYYESVGQESNSRSESDPQEEVTPSYYESTTRDIVSEASQSYFAPEEATPSYSSQSIAPSYYDSRPESEASQSFYSTQDLGRTEQSSSQNVEASQSFYQEATDELRLRQRGEATPTYSARYPVDYTIGDSSIERHDLVESSVPATRPAER